MWLNQHNAFLKCTFKFSVVWYFEVWILATLLYKFAARTWLCSGCRSLNKLTQVGVCVVPALVIVLHNIQASRLKGDNSTLTASFEQIQTLNTVVKI